MIICYDMFQGGFETSSNTLAFGILYMILHPDVQKKVQEELDSIISEKRTPIPPSEKSKLLKFTLILNFFMGLFGI